MNNTLNATRMQLPSGTHFHKDKQKCLLLPQSGKVRMDANGPLAKNYRKLNLHAKEASTWTVVHFLLSGSKPGNLKPGESQPVLPSASLTSRCVSAGRFAAPSLAPPSLPCYLHCAWSYVIWSNINRFAEGFEISWITFAPCASFPSSLIFPHQCWYWIRQKENSPAIKYNILTLEQYWLKD